MQHEPKLHCPRTVLLTQLARHTSRLSSQGGRGSSFWFQLGCQGCSCYLFGQRKGQRPAGPPPTRAALLLQGLPIWPFGATFSSHWFSRLGGVFTRSLHLLIWISHILMQYVDDLLLWQDARVLPLSASRVLAFCSCFNIPLSWRQTGPVITWIGWELNFGASSTASGMSAPQIGES